MKGQMCGLCGKADGEIRQEYTTPSGYLTKSSVSFAHSWVLPAESCRDASRKFETVKLEKQRSDRQASKCYSVEHVLHCLPGCLPNRTSHITVGYYCLPSNLRETAAAHMACHCTECV
uniref:VWFD domain-containing protein n=1 Tax=Sinocyclocheilus rhinocerous TaxID=307959 RepID=A0A673K6W3_9TELE